MDSCRQLYLDLLKRSLVGTVLEDAPVLSVPIGGFETRRYIPKIREWGRDVPGQAQSMIGLRRMQNIEDCVERILADCVLGDLIEAGVWRGGAVIFMRGVLKAHGVTDRCVWAADSFAGLPEPRIDLYPADRVWEGWGGRIAVPLEEVRRNFERYGLLDEQVRFLPGWFRESLPSAPIERLALLRMDGDLYESTRDALDNLYPRLSAGGFAIVDDYFVEPCRTAVHDYRRQHGIDEPIVDIDGMGVYWRRER